MKIKGFFTIIILLIISIFTNVFSVKAALPNTIGPISQEGEHIIDTAGDGYGMALKASVSQNVAVICTDYSKLSPANGNQTCTLITENTGNGWTNATRYGVAAIINAAKGGINLTETTVSYFAAEMAINEFLSQVGGGGHDVTGSLSDTYKTNYNNYLEAGLNAYNDYVNASKISISLSSENLTFSLSGNNYVSNEVTVSGGTLENVTTTVGTVEKTGNKFKVSIPTTSVTEEMEVKVTTVVSKELEQARNYNCGEYQSVTPVKLETVKIEASKELTGTVELSGKLIINKYDNKNNALSGATIKVTGKKGYNQTFTTNGNPIIINNLEFDTYTVEEISAPAGYIKAGSQTVTLSESKLESTINIINKATKISINKYDYDNSTKLKGAILKLTDEEGNVLDTCRDERNKKVLCKWITTNSAYTIEALPAGIYYLLEETAPKGYNLKSEKIKVEIKENGNVLVDEKVSSDGTINIYNSLTRVEISKISTANGKALKGATLEILDSEEKEIACTILDKNGKTKLLDKCSWVSDDDKTIVVGLEEGEYYLNEVKAPEGYEKKEGKIKFNITIDGKTTIVKVENSLIVDVPDTLSARSTLLIAISMFDIALGIGIVAYVKKNKIKE